MAAGTVGFRATNQWADFDNIVVSEITALPVFSCAGFEAPLAIGPVTVRGKRALPLKARLFDPEGNAVPDYELTAPPVVQVFFDPGDGTDPIDVTEDALPAGHGSEGNQFFFDNDGYWHFNLKTANYSASGIYTIFMETGDDSEYLIDPTCETSFVRQ